MFFYTLPLHVPWLFNIHEDTPHVIEEVRGRSLILMRKFVIRALVTMCGGGDVTRWTNQKGFSQPLFKKPMQGPIACCCVREWCICTLRLLLATNRILNILPSR